MASESQWRRDLEQIVSEATKTVFGDTDAIPRAYSSFGGHQQHQKQQHQQRSRGEHFQSHHHLALVHSSGGSGAVDRAESESAPHGRVGADTHDQLARRVRA